MCFFIFYSYAMNSENWLTLFKNNDSAYSYAKVRDFLILELLLFSGELESAITKLVTTIE